MRFLVVFLAAGLFPSPLLSRDATHIWQPPRAVPAECSSLSFDMVLLDVSQSMKGHGRFDAARQQAAQFLDQVPACSLVVVGAFGLTADVRDGQFLVHDGKARLLATLNGLRPTQSYTNEDEAAKLIELTSYQLREAYGAQASRLVVRVYSDFESSPSTDKPRFSVGRFLADRMSAGYSRLTLEEQPKNEGGEASDAPPASGRVPPASAKLDRTWLTLPAFISAGVVVILGLVGLLVTVIARGRHEKPAAGETEALLVTESVAAEDRATPPTVHPVRRVEVAPGVPAVFSTDPVSATYIAAVVPGAPAGELFRIVPLPHGSVRIACSISGATLNDVPFEKEHLEISLAEPIRLRLGPREFNISGVVRRARALGGNDVFESGALQH